MASFPLSFLRPNKLNSLRSKLFSSSPNIILSHRDIISCSLSHGMCHQGPLSVCGTGLKPNMVLFYRSLFCIYFLFILHSFQRLKSRCKIYSLQATISREDGCFLDASSHLCERACLSVCWSVGSVVLLSSYRIFSLNLFLSVRQSTCLLFCPSFVLFLLKDTIDNVDKYIL